MLATSTRARLASTAIATLGAAGVLLWYSPAEAVRQTRADLQCVSKTQNPDQLTAGQSPTVTYTITVRNNGPSPAVAAKITDILPNNPSASFDSADLGCTNVAGTVTCDLGNLASGQQVSRQILIDITTAPANEVYTNVASVSSDTVDSNTGNNGGAGSACQVVLVATEEQEENADLQCLQKTVDKTDIPAGTATTLTYTVKVKNNGPDPAIGVDISDTLPAGVTFNAGGSSAGCSEAAGVVTCTIGNMNSGEEQTRTIVVNVPALAGGSSLVNQASVDGDQDSDPSNNNGPACQVTTTVTETGNEACSPGFWKTHKTGWDGTPPDFPGGTILTSDLFLSAAQAAGPNCTAGASFPTGITMGGAIDATGGGLNAFLRFAAAALVSADYLDNPVGTLSEVRQIIDDYCDGDISLDAATNALKPFSDDGPDSGNFCPLSTR